MSSPYPNQNLTPAQPYTGPRRPRNNGNYPRTPQLFSLRGDSMKTKHAFCCYILLLIVVLLVHILSIRYAPHSLERSTGRIDCDGLSPEEKIGKFCAVLKLHKSKIWTSFFMNITEYNQFLLVRARPVKRPGLNQRKIEKMVLEYNLAVDHVDAKGVVTSVAWAGKDHKYEITCDTENHDVNDVEHICDPFTLFIEPELMVGNYRLEMAVKNQEDLDPVIEGFIFEAYRINDDYTGFLFTVRYVAFTVSLILSICYCVNYFMTPGGLRVFEQNYVLVLSVGLNLFNDPFVGMNLISPSEMR